MKLGMEELKSVVRETVQPLINEAVEPVKEQQTDFMARVMAHSQKQETPKERIPGEVPARFIRAIAAGKGDISRAIRWTEDKLGGDEDVIKALGTSDATAGGFLVPEPLSQEIIELLRARSIMRSLGATVMPMATGVLTIPKITAGSTAAYVGESTAQNATEPTIGQIRLTWKKLRATVPVSNELLRYSSPSADAVVRDDLVNSLATREDQAFIRDDGLSDTPRGLRFWANGTTASAGTTTANLETDFRVLLDGLMDANVRMIRPAFLMASRSKNFMMTARDANGNLAFNEARTASPSVWGIPIGVTNNIPINLGGGSNESEVYLVDMADAIIGEANALEISVSDVASYTDSGGTLVSAHDRDETVIRAIMRHDFALRHAESCHVITGVTWGA